MPKTFKVQHEFTKEQISDVLCSGFDGGSWGIGHWAEIVLNDEPTTWEFQSDPNYHDDHDYPLNPGGAVYLKDTEDSEDDDGIFCLNLEAIQKGLNVFAKECPGHYADLIAGNVDAETGDAFIQCCLFGKVVYC